MTGPRQRQRLLFPSPACVYVARSHAEHSYWQGLPPPLGSAGRRGERWGEWGARSLLQHPEHEHGAAARGKVPAKALMCSHLLHWSPSAALGPSSGLRSALPRLRRVAAAYARSQAGMLGAGETMSKAFTQTGLCNREETSADNHGQSDGAGGEQALPLSETLAQRNRDKPAPIQCSQPSSPNAF